MKTKEEITKKWAGMHDTQKVDVAWIIEQAINEWEAQKWQPIENLGESKDLDYILVRDSDKPKALVLLVKLNDDWLYEFGTICDLDNFTHFCEIPARNL